LGARPAAIARRSSSPWRRLAGLGRSRPSGLHPGRDQVLENAGGTRNPSRRSARRIGARGGAPRGGGGSGYGGQGDAHAEGERGDKNERGVYLTAQGCCSGSWRPGIEDAGVKSWRRKVGWRRRARGARGQVDVAMLRAPGSHGRLGEVLRRQRRGQCGLRCHGGRQLRGGGSPAAAARGPIPASARAWRRE
jgi:hypothetical protein